MTSATVLSSAPDLSVDDYVVIGLATCYVKSEGEIHEVKVAEPIPSAALESILKGIPTSYEAVVATSVGQILTENQVTLPAEFPGDTQVSDDLPERLVAAARTYKANPGSQAHIPQGGCCRELNFSVERKRLLNSERIVNTEDNVKQHSHTHQVL